MGFWLNPLNKVRGSHKLKILSHFIVRHEKHQLHYTPDLFLVVTFLKKTVANKLLNGTTGAVGDIQRHHAKQFTVFSSCSIICNTINFRITNE